MSGLINNIRITSPYGERILQGKRQFHDGLDFVSSTGDQRVYSIGEGVCCFDFDDYDDRKRWTDAKHSGGNYTIITTKIAGVQYYVKYLHLVENYVSKGQIVKAGDLIGKYADVGYSYGSHLHLNIYNMEWRAFDPTPLLMSLKII